MIKADREKCLVILNWCIKKFGKSKEYNVLPKLKVYTLPKSSFKHENKSYASFSYYSFTISVFIRNHNTYLQLCDSIIHEYKHYQMCYLDYEYQKEKLKEKGYDKKMVYKMHPHEIKARKKADKWKHKCYEDLKTILHKRK